ncbi:MAG: diadenylate cyclase CdaA [Candidatus Eremiobacteraeota bacterium]|nr:diadenylate cyclase CdaA [Candidatus Eremiobacteraeota bacterium]
MEFLLQFLNQVELTDFFDVLLVALCLYFVLLAIQRTRAVQIIQGVGVILLLLLVAHAGRLQTLSWLLNWFLVSLAVLVPIVFQPELRRALMRLGQQGMLPAAGLGKMDRQELATLLDDLAYAASSLASLRHGALIVLEREAGLEDFIETGQRIEGLVSGKLLISLFHPKTPLHDGAVIVRGNRIVAGGCYLSLSAQTIDAKFGTRHRAALGVSEQSDCVVVVVSEESGEVRLAHDGAFSRPLVDEGEVKKQLGKYLVSEPKK